MERLSLNNLSMPVRMAVGMGLISTAQIAICLLALAAIPAAEGAVRTWVIIATVASVAWCGLTGFVLSRAFTRPFEIAVGHIGRIASGDLSARMTWSGRDEFAWLMWELKKMQDSLKKLVASVSVGADAVASAAAEIAQGNSHLSQRTEQQASSLEQTNSLTRRMTDNLQRNADSARQADQLARNAAETAGRGGTTMGEVVTTMQAISERSNKIADITSVIDGIAFQTNILALNAAVEAARAGEQGRGFAVVASEVRNLAQRSADAAREIKSLIVDSVTTVEGGARLVDDAGATMREIVDSIQRVSDMFSEINAANTEQRDGIAEVGRAVAAIDEATQHNAALVEQTAAAAASLRDQAAQLVTAAGAFKV